MITVNTLNFTNIKVSSFSSSYNRNGTDFGPRDFKLQYSLDNSNWIDVAGTNITAQDGWNLIGLLTNIQLPEACNNQENVYLRWIMRSNIATDGGAIRSTQTSPASAIGNILVTGTATPLPPTNIVLSNAVITENSPIGSIVGFLGVVDPNACDTHTFSLVAGDGDTHNNLFSITGSNLTVNNATISSGSYSVRINANDGANNYSKQFSITVNTATIWTGPKITFTKANYADWTLESNQDRITPLVWITRGNTKPIFNIKTEATTTGNSCEIVSPIGTEWAIGTTADFATLVYDKFLDICGCTPTSLVGQNMVLHLIDENIFLDIKFLSWTEGNPPGGSNGAGFSYVRSTDPSLPVELQYFTGSNNRNNVTLSWVTSNEVNNYGFEIERSLFNSEKWDKISFINGSGNSNSAKTYSFNDESLLTVKYIYRLKQIDNDGSFSYSQIVNIEIKYVPNNFSLEQNFPNPFNPTTTISFQIAELSKVSLKVYDILGNEVSEVVNEMKEPGKYEVAFNSTELPSGVYFYTIQAGAFTSVKKLTVLK